MTGKSFYLTESDEDDRSVIQRRDAGELASDSEGLLSEVADLRQSFLTKMDDDFNTGGATSDLFLILNVLNRYVEQNRLEENKADPDHVAQFSRAVETFRELAALLGLFLKPQSRAGGGASEEVLDKVLQLMIQMRTDARANKDFATSDRIRDELAEVGVTLEDRKEGTVWRLG